MSQGGQKQRRDEVLVLAPILHERRLIRYNLGRRSFVELEEKKRGSLFSDAEYILGELARAGWALVRSTPPVPIRNHKPPRLYEIDER